MSELSLIPVTDQMRAAFARSRSAFAAAVGMHLPSAWPEFPQAFEQSAQINRQEPWIGYLFSIPGQVIGNGGFVGPPDETNTVEIGYEVAPAFRNRGYATAAAKTLIAIAFEHGAARIIAHSLGETNASNAVMRRAGMVFEKVLPHPRFGEIWRFSVHS